MTKSGIIKGEKCYLVPFELNDETVGLMFTLLNDKDLMNYLNPDYPLGKPKSVIKKWVAQRIKSKREKWYLIKVKNVVAGYVAYKWKPGFDLACELSTALLPAARGFKIGFESSKIMMDNIAGLNRFRYITAFCTKSNLAAARNLKKLGFRKSKRLHEILEKEFYDEENPDPENSIYQLMAFNAKRNGHKE